MLEVDTYKGIAYSAENILDSYPSFVFYIKFYYKQHILGAAVMQGESFELLG